jgi:hypothetical protein
MNGVLVAGPTPFIATALVAAASGGPQYVALFVIGCQVLTIIGVSFSRAAVLPPEAASR